MEEVWLQKTKLILMLWNLLQLPSAHTTLYRPHLCLSHNEKVGKEKGMGFSVPSLLADSGWSLIVLSPWKHERFKKNDRNQQQVRLCAEQATG